jgi:predicted RecA/RadA family phage recombinase
MNNFVSNGDVLVVKTPIEVYGGDCLKIGALFGISKTWADKGEKVEIFTSGVFDVKKSSLENWQVGDPLYWNEDTNLVTNLSGSNQSFVGVAIESTNPKMASIGRMKLFHN